MATNVKIKKDIQSLTPGPDTDLVDLYTLDATSIGGTIAYFTPMTDGSNSNIVFNGVTYIAFPVEVEGMEITGDGRLPRPILRVSNVTLAFIGMINAYQDGIGAKVTRVRTFKKYLDGMSEADTSAKFPTDVFFIEQKKVQNKNYIEWELVAPIDIGERIIPKNQVLPYCQHRYRIYDSGFDYTLATCPYTGTNYFTSAGVSTTIDKDKCSKELNGCELRFGSTSQLPFKGFPVIGQLGQSYR